MALTWNDKVLAETFGPSDGTMKLLKQALLVVVGVFALAIAAKIKLPMWPSPVPVTMGTFAVLTIGAGYGARLGLVTILAYMLVGAIGFNVFAGSSAEKFGWAYMTGGTGGYLLGYVLAVIALGVLAQRGWDKSVLWMALAMLIGNALIYIPGAAWLHQVIVAGDMFKPAEFGSVWDQTLQWGVTPYLIGDAIKLALAALIVPGVWKLLGSARG